MILDSSSISTRGVMPERLMDIMDGGQQSLQLSQSATNGFGLCAHGFPLLSMASGVLPLALSWGDPSGGLTR